MHVEKSCLGHTNIPGMFFGTKFSIIIFILLFEVLMRDRVKLLFVTSRKTFSDECGKIG